MLRTWFPPAPISLIAPVVLLVVDGMTLETPPQRRVPRCPTSCVEASAGAGLAPAPAALTGT